MIILDTNVFSEPLKPMPHAGVARWLVENSGVGLFLTSISIAELMAGAALLPDSPRKQTLTRRLDETFSSLFGERILSFDKRSAMAFAEINAQTRRKGRVMSYPDCQIAAIAISNGMSVATRDTQPFLNAGVNVINPWTDE